MFVILLYKNYILERVIVKYAILRNMSIDRGEAEKDYHIPQGDMFYYRPLRNVIFI